MAAHAFHRKQQFQFFQEWFEGRLVQMQYDALEPRFNLLRQFPYCFAVISVLREELANGNRPAHSHPDGRAKKLFALIIDADWNEFQLPRSSLNGLCGHARGTRSNLLELDGIVTSPLWKNSYRIPRGE